MKFFFSLIILALFVFKIESTILDITSKKQICIYKKFGVGDLHLAIEFVSEKEKYNTAYLYEPGTNNELIKKDNFDFMSESIALTVEGEYSLCFINNDSNVKKSVSFYIMFSHDEEEQSRSIDPQSIYTTLNFLRSIKEVLEKLSNNQHMSVETNSAHADILDTVNHRIKLCTGFKILMAILVSFVQLVVLKNFFKEKQPKTGSQVGQEMF